MSSTNATRNRKVNHQDDGNNTEQPMEQKKLNKSSNHSVDSENESPRKSRNRILKHLESSLSPKYIEFNESTGGHKSRYGREHKYKETDGFLPTEVVYAYQRVGKVAKTEIKINTNLIMIKPLRNHCVDDNFYESPIEKLISKNKKLILGSADVVNSRDMFEKTKKRLFTSTLSDEDTKNSLLQSPSKSIHTSTPKPESVEAVPPTIVEQAAEQSLILKPVETSTPKLVVKKLVKVDSPRRKANGLKHKLTPIKVLEKPEQATVPDNNIPHDVNNVKVLMHDVLPKSARKQTPLGPEDIISFLQTLSPPPVTENSIVAHARKRNKRDSPRQNEKKDQIVVGDDITIATPIKKLPTLDSSEKADLVLSKSSAIEKFIITPSKPDVKESTPRKVNRFRTKLSMKYTSPKVDTTLQVDSVSQEILDTGPISTVKDDDKGKISPRTKNGFKTKLSLKSPTKAVNITDKSNLTEYSNKNEDQQPTSMGSDLGFFNSLKEGDVLWAKLSTYPYWPCIVVADDKKSILSDATIKKVHVKFFADNGRRCWVSLSSILPYNGLDDFNAKKTADEQRVQPKKNRHGRILKPFHIPQFQQSKWESAVKEADEVFAQPYDDRLSAFDMILDRNKQLKKQHASMLRQQRKTILQKRQRSRSPTPECPPYEPIGFTPKKIKMESNSTTDLVTIFNLANDIGKDVALSFLMSDTTNLSVPGGDVFYDNFDKKYLGNDENLLINKDQLENFTKKLWNLKNNNLNNNIIKIEIKDELLSENSLPDEVAGSSTSIRSSISSGTANSVVDTNMTEFSKNYLFRKLTRQFVCRICFKTKNLLKCEGACNGWYHKSCLGKGAFTEQTAELSEFNKIKRKPGGDGGIASVATPPEFLCSDCKNGLSPACFVCKKYDNEIMEMRLKCKNHACGRFYHKKCLKYFPQAKIFDDNILICPAHSCHTCISDDPKGKYLSDRSSYVKCVICPASYHMDSMCIPAGTEFITAIQIICPKHREYSKQQNCNWCFICVSGGNLVCCETCPTAFHPECLKIPLDEKGYICEECETGRMPLYGEIVWAKLGRYRWWPAQIIPPPAIPEMMSRVPRKKADFCVKFFGSNNFAWLNRGRVYLYQEGDWGKIKNKSNLEKQYENALIEAKTMYDILNQQKMMRKDEQNVRLRPLPYIKIKTNRAVPPVKLTEDDINDLNACNCDPNDEEPCGPYSGCLNRLLMFECHPRVCPARNRCMNQMFEKRLYPNVQVKRTDLRGWGLVTLEDLKPGTFIIEYVGEVIDNEEFQRRVKKMQEIKDENYYFLTMIKDLMIDAGPKGNVARFMNHSCEPNCETQKWTVNGITRVGLFSLVDIPANTELTFNYNLESIGNEKKACYCGATKCSGFIGEKLKTADKKSKSITRNSSTSRKKVRK